MNTQYTVRWYQFLVTCTIMAHTFRIERDIGVTPREVNSTFGFHAVRFLGLSWSFQVLDIKHFVSSLVFSLYVVGLVYFKKVRFKPLSTAFPNLSS